MIHLALLRCHLLLLLKHRLLLRSELRTATDRLLLLLRCRAGALVHRPATVVRLLLLNLLRLLLRRAVVRHTLRTGQQYSCCGAPPPVATAPPPFVVPIGAVPSFGRLRR